MNIREINGLIEDLKDNLDDACLASGIISYDQGSTIAGYNFDDKSAALLGKYTTFLQEMVIKSGLGSSCQYYAINLPGNIMAFQLIFDKYCWATMVDVSKVPLGMVMNAILPDCIESFQRVFR